MDEWQGPDALSRAPVSDPSPEDQEAEEDVEYHVNAITTNASRLALDDQEDTDDHLRDPMIDRLRTVASKDDNYQTLIDNIQRGFPASIAKAGASVAAFWNIRKELSLDDGLVLYGPRIVVPAAARREVLARLHDSHQGVDRTKRRARQSVYWPGISNDITTTVFSCAKCQERLPSQQREPTRTEPPPRGYLKMCRQTSLVITAAITSFTSTDCLDGQLSYTSQRGKLRLVIRSTHAHDSS